MKYLPSILLAWVAWTFLPACARHHMPTYDRPHSGQKVYYSPQQQLQNGPMLGYVDMREVLIWVQTKQAAWVSIEYTEQGEHLGRIFRTTPIRTEAAHAFTAKCIADQVQPGRSYTYRVFINNTPLQLAYPTAFKTQPLWQWRTDPPAFTLATGSCAYINEEPYDRPGKPYGSDYQIFTSLAQQKPDLMLWLGDNVYYREPDWNTHTGMVHRYTHDRALPELQPLWASTPHYAIWDDHDFGPNDSDGTWIHKEMAWEVFRDFWGNPTFGLDDRKGCTTRFQYADVDFFLLDNRYFRSPNYCRTCTDRTLLGKEQMDWLIGSLAASSAPFKLVAIGGQVLTDDSNHETAFHFFPAERDTLLARIEREKIKGVVFLTGDRHFTELSAMKNKAGRMIYDLTTSSLTAGSFENALTKTTNSFRVEGTVVDQHNFSLLTFSGPRKARKMTISVRDKEGKELWTRTIEQE